MTLAETLNVLVDLVKNGPPSAVQVEARMQPQATARSVAGPNLDRPTWARSTTGADDVFLGMDGDIAGIQVHEDSRGWGAYAEVAVRRGTLADVESVAGPTEEMPRNPDDFTSGARFAAYPWRGGWTVRLFAELDPEGTGIRRVTVSYPSRSTPARPDPGRARVVQPVPPAAGRAPGAVAPPATRDGACPGCRAPVKDGQTFCGSCGRYLDW